VRWQSQIRSQSVTDNNPESLALLVFCFPVFLVVLGLNVTLHLTGTL
jgi:hypothetical protein